MSIKILNIEINNFKVFTNKIIDFNNSDFIVFDGPNGFGKTSFFDAIELLFTGKVRRYEELSKETIDGRSTFSEHPYLNENSTEGNLYIKAGIVTSGETIFLMRQTTRSNLQNNTKIKETSFELYRISSLEDNYGNLVENEEVFLTKYLGENYLYNFEHLNYIEQDENTSYLKNKDKDKKEAIGHLFNTTKFELKISQLKAIKSKIGELCNQAQKVELQSQTKNLDQLKMNLSNQKEIKYEQAIAWKIEPWDQEKIDFENQSYSDLLGENGEVNKVIVLVKNRVAYQGHRKNKEIDEFVKNDDILIELLVYSYFFNDIEKYIDVSSSINKIDTYLKEVDDVHESLKNNGLKITDELLKRFENKEIVGEYNNKRKIIIDKINSLNDLQSVVTSLKASREKIISDYKEFKNKINANCPLCGYDWKNIEDYEKNVKDQTAILEKFLDKDSKALNENIESFKGNVLKKIVETLKTYKKESKYNNDFFIRLNNSYISNKIIIDDLLTKFEKFGIEYDVLRNKDFKIPEINKLQALKEKIIIRKSAVDENCIQLYFDNIYTKLFDSNNDNLNSIVLDKIEKKVKYIDFKYSLHQNSLFKDRQDKYTKDKEIFDNAKSIKNKIDDIIKVYEQSLVSFQKKVIQDIEILFHIYTGRIVQDYQGGIGLFINNDNGIKFVENPNKSYDAIFNMSSGQLASLIISFTLALNKKYSKSKILLIDDPIQTLDDINIVSFIDLLRNDFNDRQIIISTHEDSMSAFMRYKFKKFGIETKRVNLREL